MLHSIVGNDLPALAGEIDKLASYAAATIDLMLRGGPRDLGEWAGELIGYAALMLDRIYGDLTPKQEEGLHRIQASAQHLLALINDILDLSKIESGMMDVDAVPVSLSDVQSYVERTFRQVAFLGTFEDDKDYRVNGTTSARVPIAAIFTKAGSQADFPERWQSACTSLRATPTPARFLSA